MRNNKYITHSVVAYSLSTACPQPAVTQTVPGGKRSSRDGKQTTLTLSLRRTGLASLIIAMSRLNVLGAAIAISPHFTTDDTVKSAMAPDTRHRLKVKKVKVVYSCYWNSILQLRSVICHMGSHSVICHPTSEPTTP